jgi:dynein intermediate chain 1
MLQAVNAGIMTEEYASYRLEDAVHEREKKTSLRNTFNFQARACQTFNLPVRERGIKTDPPQCSKFSRETTQWQIFDAYMTEYKKMEEEHQD